MHDENMKVLYEANYWLKGVKLCHKNSSIGYVERLTFYVLNLFRKMKINLHL